MPEGDTLFKVAARLQVMVGQTVTRFESVIPEVAPVGRTLTTIEARKWMRRNLGAGPRKTRWDSGGANAWVYNRSGELCPRCNTPIAMRRQGTLGRTTYYCPRCQGVGNNASTTTSTPAAPPRGRVLVRGPAR
ncbi:zinc finger domain-containing protein [Nannocystis bainbridge]|uniref:FPG-type domain-containing protein n=1 Tax=Nannocystis bainbridge TaxID=2995303 RepID=A0ABT5E0U0_9BACT|nr:zinc finger domain-containing protein [Nannocystis bainbridge]MDC0719038.1 hypothetical protein [Nannocystis bainbridge]